MSDDIKPSPEDVLSMSPERAGEVLARMTKDYNSGQIAAAHGLAEPPRPTDADGKVIPPVGNLFPTQEERDAQHLVETKDYLEKNGFPRRGSPAGEKLWKLFDGGFSVSEELQAQVENKLEAMQNSADWRKRFLDGDENAVAQFHEATMIIAAGKIQRQQS